MEWHKILPALVLIALWSVLGWIFLHRAGIKKELIADEAIPRPAPRALLVVVLSALVVAFSSLMLYFVLS